MKFTVTRDRAYWVREVQVVEADSKEQAEDLFYDQFDPALRIGEVFTFGTEQFSTPLEIKESEGE